MLNWKLTIALALGTTLLLAAAPAALAQNDEEASVRAFLKTYLAEQAGSADPGATKVAIGFADLDGAGAPEAIAYVIGPYWCGTGGCNALVLQRDADSYRVVTETTVTSTPIGVLDTTSNGWRDLFVTIGGGGLPAGAVKLSFDGKSYPRNPTTVSEQVDATGATVLIDEDDRGTPLE